MEEKFVDGYPFIRFGYKPIPESSMLANSKKFYDHLNERRSVRDFSQKPIDIALIKNIIATAATAPSGAHKQPWTFCLISNPEIKKQIRIEAEKEEMENYNGRMSDEWLKDLKPLQTDWKKDFLETAPYLIAVFKRIYEFGDNNKKLNNYYVVESVGIACGILLTAIHNAGLVALTHTPSPMNFLSTILKRPENERPFLLIPVGFPATDAYVPKLDRKSLNDVLVEY
jgi:iodotyrosine deiodinase